MQDILKYSLTIFIFCFPFFICKTNGQLPSIRPSAISPLVSENDPTKFCYSKLVIDDGGRLWMGPCSVAEQLYGLRLIQYDNYERWPIPVAIDEFKGRVRSHFAGVSQGNILYGFLNRYPAQSTIFTYNISKSKVTYTPVPRGSLCSIIEYEPNKFWAIGKTPKAFQIYHWDGKTLEEYASIPNTSQFIESEQDFIHDGDINTVFADNTLWFLDRKLPLISFHIPSKSFKKYELSSFQGSKEKYSNSSRYRRAFIRLIVRDKRVYINHDLLSDQFHYLDLESEEDVFKPLQIIPEGATAKGIWLDQSNNLLFSYQLENKKNRGAVLLDHNGQYFDYTPMIKDVPFIRYALAENFKKEVYLGTSTGAYLVQGFQKTSIQNFETQRGLRYIKQIGDDEFIIKVDIGLTRFEGGELKETSDPKCIQLPFRKQRRKELLTDPNGETWYKESHNIIRIKPNPDGSCLSYTFDFDIYAASFLSDGKIALIEEKGKNVYIYNPASQKLNLFDNSSIKIQGVIHYLWPSKDEILWVGTNEGLYKLDVKNQQIKHFGQSDDFEDYRILVIHEAQDGLLWLGTVNRGIHIFDPKKEKVTMIINETSGLSNNIVVGILQDDEGDIWAATYNGLTLIHPNGEIVAVLNEKNGLSHHEFNRYANLKSNDGRLFFGAISGLNVIDPIAVKQQLQTSDATKIYVTRLTYYDQKQDRNINIRNYQPDNKGVTLPAEQRFLSVNVGMSNYGTNARNRYSYKLEGIDKDWVSTGTEHLIRLPNLPPGKYNLLIAGIDHNGNWTSNTIRIPIYAKEFFYKQAWFYILCALPFLLIAIFWIRRLRMEKSVLEQEVRKRTKAIRKDKEIIEQQASELQQLDQMKSRFFANISHDLRTPITLMTGPAELMAEEEVIKSQLSLQKSVKTISQNGKKLLRLVDEMMDLARLESNKIKIHEENVPLFEFCNNIFESYLIAAQRKKLDFQFNYGLSKDLYLQTDPKRLEKVLDNLINNALKFVDIGGQISLTIAEEQSSILIKVLDNGRGIPKEDLPHVFDRFFQSKNPDLVQTSGSGIGLALCLEFAKLMGGGLNVESVFGEGSTFTLSLPLKKGKSENQWIPNYTAIPLEETASRTNGSSNGKQSTIMIVEDNKEVQNFIQSFLQTDYKILCFDDGQEALDFLKEQKENNIGIDLILSDINMPRLNGYELIEALKADQNWQQIPLIMLTARTKERSKLQALRMGVDDYLTKPFSPVELKVRIANILANYQKRQVYQKEYLAIDPEFAETHSANQVWLKELETHTLHALDQQIDVHVNYLAHQLGISERQIARKTKVITGLTIGKYILEVKLQKARHLLEQQTYPTIAEIGYQCGFKSPSYFTKVFTEYFGKTPKSYQ